MLFKKFVSLVLYILIFSVIGLIFSSFSEPDYFLIPKNSVSWLDWLQTNWAIVALVLSEISALLPGKPKGIMQAVVLILTKIFESKTKTTKKEVL